MNHLPTREHRAYVCEPEPNQDYYTVEEQGEIYDALLKRAGVEPAGRDVIALVVLIRERDERERRETMTRPDIDVPDIDVPEDFARDFLALGSDQTRIPIELDLLSAWQILGALQLACRHPSFTGPIRETTEAFARGLQERLGTTPALARVAEEGWHPKLDRRRKPPRRPTRKR